MSEIFPEDEDRCTDIIDHACLIETRIRDADVSAARRKARPEQQQEVVLDADGGAVIGDDGQPMMYWPITECVDCGEDIPEARLALGKIRCIMCQSDKETRRKQYGK